MTQFVLVSIGAICGAIATILVGFIGNVLFHLWTEKRATPSVDTFGFYYNGFPKGLHQLLFDQIIPDDVWLTIPEEKRYLRDNLRLYCFFIQSTGSGIVRNLKIKAHAKEGSGIVSFTFNVERLVICDRLTTQQDEDKSVTASWAYLNPNDFIEFYVLATGVEERADIAIDVDGEGVSIRETFPGNPISLVNPFRFPFISVKNDQFLLKFVHVWMTVASYGQEDPPAWINNRNEKWGGVQ